MNNLTGIFCDVDDFCRVFMPEWEKTLIADGTKKRNRQGRMNMSEIMTIILAFHMSHHRDFNNYYKGFVARFWSSMFLTLLSYTRFLEVMPKVLSSLSAYFFI